MVAYRGKPTPDSPLFNERCWLLSDVHRHVHGAPKKHTLLNWARNGSINPFTQETVFLEVIWWPRGRATSQEAYDRFIRRLNDPNYRTARKAPPAKAKKKTARKKT